MVDCPTFDFSGFRVEEEDQCLATFKLGVTQLSLDQDLLVLDVSRTPVLSYSFIPDGVLVVEEFAFFVDSFDSVAYLSHFVESLI